MKKHLKLSPQKAKNSLGFGAWWYEEATGIDVYICNPKGGDPLSAEITWAQLRRALARMDKP